MSEVNEQNEHVWAREQMATVLAGGLFGEELARFEAHVRTCAECGREWEQVREGERKMLALFEAARAREGLADRVIQRLRQEPVRRRLIHPAVKFVATGIAATIVVGGFGLMVNDAMERGGLPDVAQVTGRRAAVATTQTGFDLFGGTAVNDRTDQDKVLYDDVLRYPGSWADKSPSSTPAVRAPEEVAEGDVLGVRERMKGEGAAANGGKLEQAHGAVAGSMLQMGNAPQAAASPSSPAAGPNAPVLAPAPAQTETRGTENLSFYAWPKGGAEGNKAREVHAFKPAVLGEEMAKDRSSRAVVGGVEKQLAQKTESEVVGGAKLAPVGSPSPLPSPEGRGGNGPSPLPSPGVPGEGEKGQNPPTTASVRKIIRNGQMEFEVEKFDSAFAIVTKIVGEAGGYVASTNSDKLPNGKVKGTVVVRVPPEKLDTVVMQLRSLGDLKSQKLEAQDISKQYQDLDSELTADRAMEARLLEIIKTSKAQMKDLLAAEKELATWREKIEKIVGQMKYYDNLVAMSTLSLSLYEKEIKTAATAIETETVDTGVETTDVEKARTDALKAIDESKGRVIQSDLKRYDAGQFGATIVADVAADRSGALLDRIKQLGKVARLDVSRKQTDSTPGENTRVERKETRFNISLYNLANVAPRVTTNVNLAVEDAETTYRSILARVQKIGGRIVGSTLNRDKPTQISGNVVFEVPSADADAMENELKGTGEVMKLTVAENPDAANVTTAKHGFNVQLVSASAVGPRETATVQVAASDVAKARQEIAQAAAALGARVMSSNLNESDRQNVTAALDLEVKREKLADFEKAVGSAGDVVSRNVTRANDADNTIDTKVRVQLSLVSVEKIVPRMTTNVGVEVTDVDAALADIQSAASGAGGRVISSNLSKDRQGRTVGRVLLDVPYAQAESVTDQARKLGTVRVFDTSRNPAAPEGRLARARIEVSLANAEAIVEPGHGVWASVRQALSTSAAGLLWSLQIVIIGLCFVLPWVVLVWGSWRVWRRGRKAGDAGVAPT